MLDLLMCVHCRGRLSAFHDGLSCFGCGALYRTIRGVPVLTPTPHAPEVRLDEAIARPISPTLRERLVALDGYWLNLGAGATEGPLPNCIELDTHVFRNTTVVADATRLPLTDECVSAVVSLGALDQLAEPELAAAEIYRVLVPGGEVVIHTAFLQPIHADRPHYYNATDAGVHHWFRRFELKTCTVPPESHPVFSFARLASELLRLSARLGEDAVRRLEGSTLGEWDALWRDPTKRRGPLWDLMGRLPRGAQRPMAAGFEFRGRKPARPG